MQTGKNTEAKPIALHGSYSSFKLWRLASYLQFSFKSSLLWRTLTALL